MHIYLLKKISCKLCIYLHIKTTISERWSISEAKIRKKMKLFQWKQGSVLPFAGASTVTFMLHRCPWQHLTMWLGEGGVAQVALPWSSSWRQPFWWTTNPSLVFTEEKHCWPVQRSPPSHDRPSHTHSMSCKAGITSSTVKKIKKREKRKREVEVGGRRNLWTLVILIRWREYNKSSGSWCLFTYVPKWPSRKWTHWM